MPAELRIPIYREVLLLVNADRPTIDLPPEDQSADIIQALQLLLVGRQIRIEATPVFWEENAFRVFIIDKVPQSIDTTVATIGYRHASMLKHFTIAVEFFLDIKEDVYEPSDRGGRHCIEAAVRGEWREVEFVRTSLEAIGNQVRGAIDGGIAPSSIKLQSFPKPEKTGVKEILRYSAMLAIYAMIREIVGTPMPVDHETDWKGIIGDTMDFMYGE